MAKKRAPPQISSESEGEETPKPSKFRKTTSKPLPQAESPQHRKKGVSKNAKNGDQSGTSKKTTNEDEPSTSQVTKKPKNGDDQPTTSKVSKDQKEAKETIKEAHPKAKIQKAQKEPTDPIRYICTLCLHQYSKAYEHYASMEHYKLCMEEQEINDPQITSLRTFKAAISSANPALFAKREAFQHKYHVLATNKTRNLVDSAVHDYAKIVEHANLLEIPDAAPAIAAYLLERGLDIVNIPEADVGLEVEADGGRPQRRHPSQQTHTLPHHQPQQQHQNQRRVAMPQKEHPP